MLKSMGVKHSSIHNMKPALKPVQRKIEDVQIIVKPIIESIGKDAGLPDLYEQIRHACSVGLAFVFTFEEGESFTVLRPMGNGIVQIWIAYSKDGNATEQYLPYIKDLCREIGATQIEFETVLESMERIMPRFGWEKKYTVWRQSIDE